MSTEIDPMADDTNLPAAANARLPVTYEAARKALAECSRIDECRDWTNKAQAIASYAKQAKDNTLQKLATKIQARAVRRCGELLKEVPRGDEATRYGQDAPVPPVTRTQVATDAGLSERQRKTALRVASIPQEEFDREVESDSPPTVTELAIRGTESRPPPVDRPTEETPADRAEVLEAVKAVYEFSQFCGRVDPVRVAIGIRSDQAPAEREEVKVIEAWLSRFTANLPHA